MQKVQQITEDTQHLQAQLKDVTQLVSYLTLHLTEDSAAGLMTGLYQRLVDIRQSIADLVSKYKSIKTDHCITFPQEKEKKKHEAVSRKGFPQEEGPFVRSLDTALKTFAVEQQAYYGGTFVGNHVHRTLKVRHNYTV